MNGNYCSDNNQKQYYENPDLLTYGEKLLYLHSFKLRFLSV